MCVEYENGGVLRAVAFSSLFFGLLHFNVVNLPVSIFAGVILALTLYATRSLIAAVAVHILYNIFGLFGQPYLNALYNITGSTKFFIFFAAVLFFASTAIFCAQASRLYRKYLYRGISANYRRPVLETSAEIRSSYIEVLRSPSAIACFAIYIIALIISWL